MDQRCHQSAGHHQGADAAYGDGELKRGVDRDVDSLDDLGRGHEQGDGDNDAPELFDRVIVERDHAPPRPPRREYGPPHADGQPQPDDPPLQRVEELGQPGIGLSGEAEDEDHGEHDADGQARHADGGPPRGHDLAPASGLLDASLAVEESPRTDRQRPV